MPLVLKDRVKETSTTTGTGTLTLGGAATGFQSFAVIGNGNTTYYAIFDRTSQDWEVGVGTYTASGTTLSRDSVLESSNSGSLVNFGAGTKDVFCTYPAEKAVTLDDVQTLSNKTLSNPSYTGTLTGGTGVVNLGSGQFYKDASGNVGIGTSSPNYKTQINGGTVGTTIGNRADTLKLETNTSNSDQLNFYKIRDGSGSSWETAAWRIQQRIDVTDMGYIQFNGSGLMDGLAFGTANTERMRIDSAGRVGIGTSSPSSLLHLRVVAEGGLQIGAGDANKRFHISYDTSNNIVKLGHVFSDGYNLTPLTFWTSGTERMRISSIGAVYFPGVGTTASAANAFLNSASSPANQLLRSTSSIRYKTDVETVETPFADKVLELRPVWYRSKAEADNKGWSWYGLIAEEVAEVEPRLVHWSYPESAYEEVTVDSEVEGEEPKTERKLKEDAELVPDGVQYERLSVLLLDVVKRQQEAIEQLKTRIEALEGN